MKKNRFMSIIGFVLLLFGSILFSTTDANAILVDVYSGFTTSGGGIPYSNFVNSFTTSDIQFGASTSFDWHPYGLSSFGADFTGYISVPSNSTYTFTLTSDDGSLLYINNNLVVNDGGQHFAATVPGSIALNAGTYPFEVQFFENGIGPSGIDLTLASGATYVSPVPEPAAIFLLGLGLAGLAAFRMKFRAV